MKKADVACVVGSVFVAATAFFYCFPLWFTMKLPHYYPVEHTWKMSRSADAVSQGWYGMQVFAFAVAGAVALITYFGLKIMAKHDLKSSTIKLMGITTNVVIVACMAYMLCHEFRKWGVF